MGTVLASHDHASGESADEQAKGAILDATRALTIGDNAAPVVGVSWTDFVDPKLAMAEFGMMWMPARFEGALHRSSPEVSSDGLDWAARYLEMNGNVRRTLNLAIDRLNLARRRLSPGDQAIDGGICLEALLGDEGPGEINYKLRLRAALLLGKTLAERQEIKKKVGKLYDLRSKIVHGRERSPDKKLHDIGCASVGLEICAEVIRAIVLHGDLPNFNALELTSGI